MESLPSSLPPLSFTRSRLRNPRRQRRSTASGRPSGLSRPSPVVRRVTRERGRGRAARRRSNCLCNSPHIAATAAAATAFLSPEVTSAESFNPKWPSYRPKGQSRRRPRPGPGLAGPPSVPSVVRPSLWWWVERIVSASPAVFTHGRPANHPSERPRTPHSLTGRPTKALHKLSICDSSRAF